MNNRALTLSIFMAVMAVFFVQSYVSSIEEEARKKFGTDVVVVTPKRDIKEMETITETALELKSIPKSFLEPAAIYFQKDEEKQGENSKGLKNLAGAVAIVPIKKGEQVTYNKLTEPSLRTGLSPQVTPGKRGISISITEVSGVSKLIKPGDRVDVIAVLDPGGGGKENRIAKTLLQDVVILATGHNVTNNVARVVERDGNGGGDKIRSLTEDSSFTSVTLEVEPIQAQLLTLVMNNGDNALTLSLRNNDDTDRATLGLTTLPDVLGPDLNRFQRGPAGGKR